MSPLFMCLQDSLYWW